MLRLAIGAAGAFLTGYVLTLFFWPGFPHPAGPALVSMLAFIGLALFFIWREKRQPRRS